jgi:hypothetical protein
VRELGGIRMKPKNFQFVHGAWHSAPTGTVSSSGLSGWVIAPSRSTFPAVGSTQPINNGGRRSHAGSH